MATEAAGHTLTSMKPHVLATLPLLLLRASIALADEPSTAPVTVTQEPPVTVAQEPVVTQPPPIVVVQEPVVAQPPPAIVQPPGFVAPTSITEYDKRLAAATRARAHAPTERERAEAIRERRALITWHEEHTHRNEPLLTTGIVLVAAGSGTVLAGGLYTLVSAFQSCFWSCSGDQKSTLIGEAIMAIGGSAVVVGIPLIVLGAQRSIDAPASVRVGPGRVSMTVRF